MQSAGQQEKRTIEYQTWVRDGNRGQAMTARESRPTNARHAVRNGDGGQATTFIVCGVY